MASRETKRVNPKGVLLRRSFEQRALQRMLDRLDEADTEKDSVEALCKLMGAYCQLIRQDAALEKTQANAGAKPRRSPSKNAADESAKDARAKTDDVADLIRTVRDLYGVDLDNDEPSRCQATDNEPSKLTP